MLLILIVAEAVAKLGPIAIGYLLGAAAFGGLVFLFDRAPQVLAVTVILGFALFPALKFFASPLFGPAKDAIVIAAGGGLVLRGACGGGSRPASADTWLVGGALAIIAMYVINPAGSHGPPWANATRLVVESFGLLLIGYLTRSPERVWKWAVRALVLMALINAGYGLVQQALGVNGLVQGLGYAYGDQVRQTATGQLRSFGTLDDPFNFAGLLCLALVAVSFGEHRRRVRITLVTVFFLGIVFSFVRTELVLIPIIAAAVLLRAGRISSAIALVLAAVVAGIGVLVFVPQTTSTPATSSHSFLLSLNGRSQAWGALINDPAQLFAGRGVGATGTGLARSASTGIVADARYQAGRSAAPAPGAQLVTSVDSTYLATVADIGLAGLVLLFALLVRIGLLATRALLQGSTTAWATLGLLGVSTVDAFTRSSLTAYPYGFVALYLIGLSLAVSESQARSIGSFASANSRLP